jgi:hypothetical protein
MNLPPTIQEVDRLARSIPACDCSGSVISRVETEKLAVNNEVALSPEADIGFNFAAMRQLYPLATRSGH